MKRSTAGHRTLAFTLMTLAHIPLHGKHMSSSLIISSIGLRPMALSLMLSTANRSWRKLIVLGTGSHPQVWNLGIKNGILQIQNPKNLSQMHDFICADSHYLHIWSQCAHNIAPLSSKSGKKTFSWTNKMDLTFKQMKSLITQDCLLTYPSISHLHGQLQLSNGSIFCPRWQPGAFCSCVQLKYTVGEKEPLSIVMIHHDLMCQTPHSLKSPQHHH